MTSVNAVISYQVVNSNRDLAVTLTKDSETVSSDLFQEVQFKIDGANAGQRDTKLNETETVDTDIYSY